MTTFDSFPRSSPFHHDENNLSSSPDPLATSADDGSAVVRSSPVKYATPSPRKRRTAKVLEDLTFLSPQKAQRQSIEASIPASCSQGEQFLSPWKIRVTVEAEPEQAGSRGVRIDSTTKRIPLDSPSPSKKPNGRVGNSSATRKSGRKGKAADSPGGASRRNKPCSLSRLIDLDTNFLDGNVRTNNELGRNPKTRKSDEQREVSKTVQASEPTETRAPTAKGRRRNDQESDGGSAPISHGLQPKNPPSIRELDFNRISVRSRHERPKTNKNNEADEQQNHNANPSSCLPAPAECAPTAEAEDRRTSGASLTTYPTPDASVQDGSEGGEAKDDHIDGLDGFDTILESEGFTMIDLESIPSARHFVSSPNNSEAQGEVTQANKNWSSDPREITPEKELLGVPPLLHTLGSSPPALLHFNEPPQTHANSYLALPEGESDLSSTVPWSTPLDGGRRQSRCGSTPFVRTVLGQPQTPDAFPTWSPELPSPPRQPHPVDQPASRRGPRSTRSQLAEVVKAGSALQRLFSPRAEPPRLGPSPMKDDEDISNRDAPSPQERLAKPPSGTEPVISGGLNAGLWGDGKSDSNADVESSVTADCAQDQHDYRDHGARSRMVSETHQDLIKYGGSTVPAFIASGHKEIGVSLNGPTVRTPSTPPHSQRSVGSCFFLDTDGRERRWQLEREAVSRQIENANSSQVIMINSDDDREEAPVASSTSPPLRSSPTKSVKSDADEDIWLGEAGDVQSLWQHKEEDFFPPVQQLRQRERAREVISKPRRSLIPSPWKRGQDIDSTTVTDDDASGLLWPLRSGLEVETMAEDEEDGSNELSLPPQPRKIAVNFNESTDLDAESELQRAGNTSLQSSPPSPCRPTTPRSALKGSRAGFQVVQDCGSPIRPRVAFSRHSVCRDESGVETSMHVRQLSISPEAFLSPDMLQDEKPSHEDTDHDEQILELCKVEDKNTAAEPESAPTPAASASWFSRLTGWSGKPAAATSSSPEEEVEDQQQPCHSLHAHGSRYKRDGAASKAIIPSTKPRTANLPEPKAVTSSRTSDSRLPPPPERLSVGGYFSDDHYKHLHILYLKSLKPTFTRPGSIRPGLKTCIGQRRYGGDGGDGGDGEFVWEITERDAEVVERWLRSFEGREGGANVTDWHDGQGKYRRVEWDEADLCLRLFSIVAGQELRREQRGPVADEQIKKQNRR